MKTRLILAASTLAAALPAFAANDIYRCAQGGAITYQQMPCPEKSVEERPNVPTEFPAPNLAERDRLFAREADLYKRLEARRDRETQEAVLREARAERELERARLEALAAQQPQYVLAYPYRMPRANQRPPVRRPYLIQ